MHSSRITPLEIPMNTIVRLSRVAAALALVALACAKPDAATTDSSAVRDSMAAPAAVTGPLPASAKIATLEGMKTPESVRYDADQDIYFVSNINGNPSQKDNNGFIAKVSAENPGAPEMFIEGGKNGVTLHAPKGMALVGDTLWVADIDAVRGFNRRTGALVRSIDLSSKGAAFLNDVAAAPDGSVWITDTGIKFDAKGAMSPSGKQQVFRIAGTAITSPIIGDSLGNPNGIAWDGANNRWLMAGFSGKDIVRFTADDHQTFVVASGPGGYDGLEVLPDGRVLVTSWTDSTVSVVEGNALRKLITGVSAPADIGIDTKRMRLALPRFEGNTVEIWALR